MTDGERRAADVAAGIDRIWNEPPPAPCGSKERPHLAHPDVVAGRRAGHCVTCGQFLVPRRTAMKWTNDYGDVPRWYWRASCFLPPPRRRSGVGRMLLAAILALAPGGYW